MAEINLFPAMGISSTGLRAERVRMEVASQNLANAHTTRGPDGKVYQRQQVVFSTILEQEGVRDGLGGVQVDGVVNDPRQPLERYMPHHPDADANGIVKMPNVSPIEEMLDMITATRAYEANLSALRTSRDMARSTIALGKKG